MDTQHPIWRRSLLMVALCVTPFSTLALELPGLIEAEDATVQSGTDTDTCSDGDDCVYVGWINSGDYLSYDIDVESSGTYQLQFRVATIRDGVTITATVDGSELATLDVTNTDDWDVWTTIEAEVELSEGSQTLELTFDGNTVNGLMNLNWMNATNLTNSLVHMEKMDTDYAIDGNHDAIEGQELYLWSTDTSNENQQWVEIYRGDGYYSYQKFDTSLCMDGGDDGSNTQAITLEECSSTNQDQHWLKVDLDNDTYHLQKRDTDYAIDGNWNGEDGQAIYLYEIDQTNVNQQWVFTVVGTAEATAESETTDDSEDTSDDYATELAQVAALGELTDAPTIRDEDGNETTLSAGDYKTIYYDALDYLGEETRVFAWVGIPEDASEDNPVPAMVLVHGGNGTAYSAWVDKWLEVGYAAISIAVEGQTDEEDEDGNWVYHDWAGPARTGIYGGTEGLTDQWMYHAVADTVLANSLMRSLPEVDAENVGVTGISWGGVITSTVMGIDDRFNMAIPIYGCGDMDNADNWWGKALDENDTYINVWDPMVRMENATMPSLWLSWPEDNNFPIDRQAVSYRGSPGERMVTLIPSMGHSHNAGWSAEESYDFADSVVETGTIWAKQLDVEVSDDEDSATVTFSSTKEISGAALISTTDTDVEGDRTWTESEATLTETSDGIWEVAVSLPTDVTGWYVNLYSDDLVLSSGYQVDDAGSDISPYVNLNDEGWSNTGEVAAAAGDAIEFAPHPESGGSWSWTGPDEFSADGRTQAIDDIQIEQAGDYIATYTDDSGNVTLYTFSISVE